MSQQMKVYDERINMMTLKNEGLSESLINVMSKLSDMERQLQQQRQQHEEERQQHEEERQRQQQNHVENCQQVEQVLQQLKGNDKRIDVITVKNEGLSESLTNVVSKLSDMEQQLQEQCQQQEEEREQHEEERQRQHHNHVENCQQVSNHYQTYGTADDKRVKIMFTSTCSDVF
uniref:Uncharacterized protein n=1 Tax=Eptatretus burgeri TaxID=7764 RepID=A0A8C4X112_EPTBU